MHKDEIKGAAKDIAGWVADVRKELDQALALLGSRRVWPDAETQAAANELLAARETLYEKLDSFKKRVLSTRKELKELRKDLRQDAEALQFWTKVANIVVVPALVALFGIGMAISRQRRATARPKAAAEAAPAATGA